MSRPMTSQGKVKVCAKNALYWLKENNSDQALYWAKALQRHIECNEKAEPGKKFTLRPEVQRLVERALSKWPEATLKVTLPPVVPLHSEVR